MRVPFIDLKKQYADLKKELDPAVHNILSEGTFILGTPVQTFEEHISDYLGRPSLGIASGTDALLLSLMAMNIKPGDEVITTPFTFFATAGCIARVGAIPVFVDIDTKTYNLDVSKIEKAITKKTKAILPVHLFGQPDDMDALMAIAKKHNLKIIEDACQAIGAEYKGKKVGTIGHFGCFSFFPTKNLGGAGDGGLITCASPEDFALLKKLRVHGSEKKYFHEYVGINSRLDALQAVILDVKLNYLEGWNKRRRAIAQTYNKALSSAFVTPFEHLNAKHIYHQYVLLADAKKRDALVAHLHEKGVETGVYYPLPLHLQPCFSYLGYKKGDFPVAEEIALRIFSIPIYPEMSDEQISYVIKVLKEFK